MEVCADDWTMTEEFYICVINDPHVRSIAEEV